MYKIKKNVDLHILEKYPFECSDSGSIFWSNRDCTKYIRVWYYNRHIDTNDDNNFILKKLIKDNLVEFGDK